MLTSPIDERLGNIYRHIPTTIEGRCVALTGDGSRVWLATSDREEVPLMTRWGDLELVEAADPAMAAEQWAVELTAVGRRLDDLRRVAAKAPGWQLRQLGRELERLCEVMG